MKHSRTQYIFEHIGLFSTTVAKVKNDQSNKIREDTVVGIINGTIPNEWFSDPQWNKLRINLFKYLHNITDYQQVVAKKMAGRDHHCDFAICFTTTTGENIIKNIEWKYGAKKVDECPQWVSPMKPSQYLTNSFEEFYYNNYLHRIVAPDEKPPLETYLKEIHGDKPKCMAKYQLAYYKGAKGSSKYTGDEQDIEYCKMCKSISDKAIQTFISQTELNVEKLNDYLYNTQMDKIYMCCKDSEIYMDIPNKDDYTITMDTITKTKNQYIGTTLSGRQIKILFRWKNGNGIAFPAFQIK